MLEKAALTEDQLHAALAQYYGLSVQAVTFLPIGYDARSFLYQVTTGGPTYFLKLRSVPVPAPTVLIPQSLINQGVKNCIAPIPTVSGALTCPLESYTATLYPFIPGHNAMQSGLTPAQWRQFGLLLRAVHSPSLAAEFTSQLPHETFAFSCGHRLQSVLAAAQRGGFASPHAQHLAEFFLEQRSLLSQMIGRAQALGQSLQSQSLPSVLCHTDCHLANVLLSDAGQLYLIDWDAPLIAPPERDLFLVHAPAGQGASQSEAASPEAAFFQGYGPHTLNHQALAYYRYERTIEDLAESGFTGLLDPAATEAERAEADRFTRWLFAPGRVEWALVENISL